MLNLVEQISLGDDCYLDLLRGFLVKDGIKISLSGTQCRRGDRRRGGRCDRGILPRAAQQGTHRKQRHRRHVIVLASDQR